MVKKKCNILILGSGSSGSSALYYLLMEYENINIIPGEFNDFRAPCLVENEITARLKEYYPNRIDEITEIRNLKWRIIYKLIPNIIWENEWNSKVIRYLKSKHKILRLNQIHFLKELNKSLKSENSFTKKLLLSRKWIQQVGNINSFNKEYVLFDQPLNLWSDVKIWTKVFRPFKLICVYRDPKDILAQKLRDNGLFVEPFNTPIMTGTGDNIMSIYGRDRKGVVRFYIDAIRKRLEYFDNLETILPPEEILFIDFEGLVNNYDIYKSVIESFIGNLKDKQKFPKKYFDPDVVRKNIDISKKYLEDEDLMELAELENWYNKKIKFSNIESSHEPEIRIS